MKGLRGKCLVAVLCVFGLVVAACGDDDDAVAPPTDETTTTVADTTTTAPDDDDDDDGVDNGDVFDDPRGGIFDDFQATMDRSSRYNQIDTFCTAGDPPGEAPTASDIGITAETIAVTHLRSTLEDLEDIGFAIPVGNVRDIFETFIRVVNEECGGVHGRTVDLSLVEAPVLGGGGQDIDALRNAACIEAVEDNLAVFVLNSSGFQGSAIRCLVEANDAIFISTQGVSEDDIIAGENRLYSLSFSNDEALKFAARDLAESGALDGKVIGVIAPDTPTQAESVQAGLVDVLQDEFGIEVARFDIIGCGGTTSCNIGNPESVSGMRSAGVDAMFVPLNVVSLPGYILEMANQGFQPGDVQFYNTDFNSQGGDLVSGKVSEFGLEAAGALYNGAILVDDAETGNYRVEGFQPRAFNEMCNATYQRFSNLPDEEKTFRADEEATVSPYGMVTTVCTQVRIMMRAIEAAGVNPTRAEIAAAVEGLGSIDVANMLPASFGPGKHTAPDSVNTTQFNFPCPGGTELPSGACIIQIEPARLVIRN